jgi:sugar lactone lactonase YvrE
VRLRSIGVVALALTAACSVDAPPTPCDETGPLATICGFRSPEDLAYAAEAGLLVVSEMAILAGGSGSLAAIDPRGGEPRRLWPTGDGGDFVPDAAIGDAGCPPPDPRSFSPHGLTLHGGNQLVVVNHGGRESVEVFTLEGRGEGVRAVWRGCVLLPAGTSGNDVVVAPDGEILVSNYLPSLLSLWGTIEVMLGLETGDLLSWRRERGWERVPGSEASGPNGLAFSAGGEWILFAETGTGRVVRLARDRGSRDEVEIGGAPDNLTWTSDGKLLAVAHDSLLALFTSCEEERPHCEGPWTLFEIDPGSLGARVLLRHDGHRIGTVATALEVGSDVWLGAVLSDRIGRWRNARSAPLSP